VAKLQRNQRYIDRSWAEKSQTLYLYRNSISDISALASLNKLVSVGLTGNDLNSDAYDLHVPALEDKGISIALESAPSEDSIMIPIIMILSIIIILIIIIRSREKRKIPVPALMISLTLNIAFFFLFFVAVARCGGVVTDYNVTVLSLGGLVISCLASDGHGHFCTGEYRKGLKSLAWAALSGLGRPRST